MQAIELSFNDLINDIPELKKFDNFYNHEIFMAELMAKYYNADNFYDDLQNIRLANKLSGININDKFTRNKNQSAILKHQI